MEKQENHLGLAPAHILGSVVPTPLSRGGGGGGGIIFELWARSSRILARCILGFYRLRCHNLGCNGSDRAFSHVCCSYHDFVECFVSLQLLIPARLWISFLCCTPQTSLQSCHAGTSVDGNGQTSAGSFCRERTLELLNAGRWAEGYRTEGVHYDGFFTLFALSRTSILNAMAAMCTSVTEGSPMSLVE